VGGLDITFSGLDAQVGLTCCRRDGTYWIKTTTVTLDGTYNIPYVDETTPNPTKPSTDSCYYAANITATLNCDRHTNDTCTSFHSSQDDTTMTVKIWVEKANCGVDNIHMYQSSTPGKQDGFVATTASGNLGTYDDVISNQAVCEQAPLSASTVLTGGTAIVSIP
jgi:hypothetical protein